jgi:amidase
MTQAWEKAAQAKREAIIAGIPKEWILDEIPTPEEQKDVTGEYVHVKQLLADREIEITEADAVDIVDKAVSRTWTAVEIIKAFCHRAAIAHQLVSFTPNDLPEGEVLTGHAYPTAQLPS